VAQTGAGGQAEGTNLMDVNYSVDVEQIDQMVKDIAAEREKGDVAIRLQPTILHKGNYVAWQGVSWRLTAKDPAEAFALRDLLQVVLQQVQTIGVDGVLERLHMRQEPGTV
jgi:hypothetical protein